MAAELYVPGDQASAAFIISWFHIPALVQQSSDVSPVRIFNQQVVPLCDDQRNIAGYGDRRSNRFFDGTIEARCVHDRIFTAVQASKQIDIAGRIKGVDSTFALIATEPLQLDVTQVEPVHAYQDRIGSQLSLEHSGKCRFAGARRSGDPKEAALAGRDQSACRCYELRQAVGEVIDGIDPNSAGVAGVSRGHRAAVANARSALGALTGDTGALTIRATVEKTGTRRLRNSVQVYATPLEPQERFLFAVTRATAELSERLPVTTDVPLHRMPTRRRRQESGCLGCTGTS